MHQYMINVENDKNDSIRIIHEMTPENTKESHEHVYMDIRRFFHENANSFNVATSNYYFNIICYIGSHCWNLKQPSIYDLRN